MRTILTLAAAGGLAALAPAAHADMMTACSPEIARFCADVRQGRGRIAACLASHREALAPACLSDLQAVARNPVIPGPARRALSPGFRAALPEACAAAAARYCPTVPPGDGRVFACLYARLDRLDAACSSAARAVVSR